MCHDWEVRPIVSVSFSQWFLSFTEEVLAGDLVFAKRFSGIGKALWGEKVGRSPDLQKIFKKKEEQLKPSPPMLSFL